MNFVLILFLCIFGFSALANPQPEYDKKIIYCPSQVECKNEQCTGIDNDKEYFKHLYISSQSFQEGIYSFVGSIYNTQIDPYAPSIYTICEYSTSYGPFKNNAYLVMKNGSNFQPLIENWTKWHSGSSQANACAADSPNICPLIEKKEIFFDSKFRQKNNEEEYSQYPPSILIELATENGALINYRYPNSADTLNPLDYEKTINACGINNKCKIYSKISEIDRRGFPGKTIFLGAITITTGDILRVVSIEPINENTSLNMTTLPPMNNTIVLYWK